jgi:hypothetical protein
VEGSKTSNSTEILALSSIPEGMLFYFGLLFIYNKYFTNTVYIKINYICEILNKYNLFKKSLIVMI